MGNSAESASYRATHSDPATRNGGS
jgi:hypothetical protein